MKKILLPVLIFLFTQAVFGQTLQDSIATYFDEIKNATQKKQELWNKDLYGPILLINPNTRQLYSNVPDSAGSLIPLGKIYSGMLPENINFANTSVYWNGKVWAMIMLPLPADKQDRINLIAHELFHTVQPSLGFKLYDVPNNHLNDKQGRIYLRLNWKH